MKHILVSLLLLQAFAAVAESGPFAPPCAGCPKYGQPPYPHTGLWYSPQRSGTGINIDVQNGILVAVYYGYRDDGSAVWHLFSGELVQSESEDVYWELEANLYEASNGEPINGEHRRPDMDVVGTIHVEILQRHLLRFSINGGPTRRMAPQVFGSRWVTPFEPQSNVRLPTFEEGRDLDVEGDLPFTPWLIIQLNPEGESRWGYAYTSPREHWGYFTNVSGVVHYRFDDFDFFPHVADSATIACGSVDDLSNYYGSGVLSGLSGEDPMCVAWSFAGNPPDGSRIYYMPLGNLGDRRFTAVSEDGWVLEGHRLMYD